MYDYNVRVELQIHLVEGPTRKYCKRNWNPGSFRALIQDAAREDGTGCPKPSISGRAMPTVLSVLNMATEAAAKTNKKFTIFLSTPCRPGARGAGRILQGELCWRRTSLNADNSAVQGICRACHGQR